MSDDRITMQVRPFEKIANDFRWTGAIEGDTYVLRVGPHVYTLRTVGVDTDDKGEYALVEPYEEPFDSGLWLRVEAEPDEWSPAKAICCRVSLQRANPIYVDPNAVLRQMKIDPAGVNVAWDAAVSRCLLDSVLLGRQADGVDLVRAGETRRGSARSLAGMVSKEVAPWST